jgi:hypothetical protein
MERLWYYHLRIIAEWYTIQQVLRWVQHRYVRTFALVTGVTHCAYFGLVFHTGHELYAYPAAILMVVTLLSVMSGEDDGHV